MRQVNATWAKRNLAQAIRDAHRDRVEILHRGKPVGVLVSPEEYSRLRAQDRRVVLAGDFDELTTSLLRSSRPPPAAKDFDPELD